MRVVCEFCDNEVEISGNMTCPHCGGVLADAVRRERERLQKITDEQRRQQLELEKERLKAEQKRLKAEAAESDNEKWGKILAGGSLLGLSPLGRIGNFFRRLFRDISGFLKILGIIAAVAVIYFIYKSFFA